MLAFLGVFWYQFKTFIWKKYTKSKETKYSRFLKLGVQWADWDSRKNCWVLFSFVESSLKRMSYGGGGDPWHDKFDPYGPAKWKYRKSSLSHIVDRIVLIDSSTCYLHFFKCGWKETDALNWTQSCKVLFWLIYLVLLLCRWDRTELICNVNQGRWNRRG